MQQQACSGLLGWQALDQWEERLESAFEGRPYDILDAALTAAVAEYPVSIQPFRDMIGVPGPLRPWSSAESIHLSAFLTHTGPS